MRKPPPQMCRVSFGDNCRAMWGDESVVPPPDPTTEYLARCAKDFVPCSQAVFALRVAKRTAECLWNPVC